MIENVPLKREPNTQKVWAYSDYSDADSLINEMGIHILTGEACALSMRLLCELEPKAMQLFLDYYGLHINPDSLEKSTWNHRDWYALFLDRAALFQLRIFYLCSIFPLVVTADTIQNGQNNTDIFCAESPEDFKKFKDQHKISFGYWNETLDNWIPGTVFKNVRTYAPYPSQPRRGFSNIHGFTGKSQ